MDGLIEILIVAVAILLPLTIAAFVEEYFRD